MGEEVTFVYENGGIFNVTLTVTDDDGKSGTARVEINAYEKPFAEFFAEPLYGIVPLEIKFDASGSFDTGGEIESYFWDFDDGLTTTGKKVSHTFSSAGEFRVVLIVTDNDGYTGETSHIIDVLVDKPLPPVNVLVEKIIDDALLKTNFINKITWQNNPQNNGLFTIAAYRIYSREKDSGLEFAFLAEVNGLTLTFSDFGFPSGEEADKYEYAITSVDARGKESDFSGSDSTI